MVAILMIWSKLATLGLLKIKVFWSKGYGVIISVRDVTSETLSADSNYIVDVVMLLKFGSSRISSRETIFFESYCWFKFNNLGLPLGMALKLYTRVAKGLKLKVRKFGKLNPTFVKVIWEKLVGGHPWLLPILNRVKQIWSFQLQVCLSISCHLVDTMP